jgi:hypothetical protein
VSIEIYAFALVAIADLLNITSRATKHGEGAVRNWAEERWLDMGMSTLIFSVHTDSENCLVVDWYVSMISRI